MSKMKAIASVFLGSALFLASCGSRNALESRLEPSPVLSPRVQSETRTRIDFARHVKPILETRCVWCHDGSDKSVVYNLSSRRKAFRDQRIVSRKPDQSRLYLMAEGQHPLVAESTLAVKMAPSDLLVLRRWIDSGAVWPEGEVGELKGQ